MNLESLRKKRHKRLKSTAAMIVRVNVELGKKSLSDYAGPKRIRNLFQRAATRFQDIGLWLQYIEYSKLQDSPKLTGKLFGEYGPFVSSINFAGPCKSFLLLQNYGFLQHNMSMTIITIFPEHAIYYFDHYD